MDRYLLKFEVMRTQVYYLLMALFALTSFGADVLAPEDLATEQNIPALESTGNSGLLLSQAPPGERRRVRRRTRRRVRRREERRNAAGFSQLETVYYHPIS